jgi:hypothetical protein
MFIKPKFIPERFSMEYTLKATLNNMLSSIEFSISKTLDRMPKFLKSEDSVEVFVTLQALQALRKHIESFEVPTKGDNDANPINKKGE